ncbi:MAG: hypothetical protein ABJF23_26920 [Bryobacteraceae bacterium]
MTKTKQFGNAAVPRPRIAAAVLSGKKVTEIAQDESISRSQASRDVNAAETKQLICELVEKQHVRMEAMFDRVLKVTEEAFEAQAYSKDGMAIGADHYARLQAAKVFLAICTAGRPTPKSSDIPKPYVPMWSDFKALYEKNNPDAARR